MNLRPRHLATAHALRARGDRAGLVRALRLAQALSPQDPRLALDLGIALREAGRSAEALPYLASAYGTDPTVLVELGRTRLAMLDLAAARAFFAAALRDGRSTIPARIGLASVERLSGAPEKALALVAAAVEADAADIESLLLQAAAWIDLGASETGLNLLRDAIDLGLERPRTLVLHARAERMRGDLAAAGDAVRLALAEPAGAFPALVELGLLEVALGREPDPAALYAARGETLLQPQEFFADTSMSAALAAPSLRFVEALLSHLGEHEVPIAIDPARAPNRLVLHLAADLPSGVLGGRVGMSQSVH